MSKGDGGRLSREIRDGRIKLVDFHWDGHQITAKALMHGPKWNVEGWEFGRGDTVPDALRALFSNIDNEPDEDLI